MRVSKPFLLHSSHLAILEKILLFLVVITLMTDVTWNALALGALSIYWIFNKGYSNTMAAFKQSGVFHALCAYCWVLVVSLTYSSNISYAFKTLETKSSLIVFPILLSGISWDKHVFNSVLKVYVLAVFTLTLYSTLSTISYYKIDFSDVSYFSWVLPDTSSFDANYYALFVAFAIIIILIHWNDFRSSLSSAGSIVVILYLAVFLAFLSSRAAILGLIVVVLFVALDKIFNGRVPQRKQGVIIILLTISICATALRFVPYLNSRVTQMLVHLKDDPRKSLFSSSLTLFRDAPLLGVGIGDVKDELSTQYLLSGNAEAYSNRYNSHNDWLQTLVSTGLLGFAALLYLIYQLVKEAYQRKSILSFAFIILYLIASMTESILERNKGVVFFTFFVTLAFIIKIGEEKKLPQPTF